MNFGADFAVMISLIGSAYGQVRRTVWCYATAIRTDSRRTHRERVDENCVPDEVACLGKDGRARSTSSRSR